MNHKYLFAATGGMPEATDGEKQDQSGIFEATAENIASFLVHNQEAPFIRIETLNDLPFLTAQYGFVFKMYDQDYLRNELLPVLAPMQLGEREPAEINMLDWKDLTDVEPIPVVDYNAYSDYISHDEWPNFRKHLLETWAEENGVAIEQQGISM